MRLTYKIINILALMACVVWATTKWPDWEPIAATLVALGALTGMEITERSKEKNVSSSQPPIIIQKAFDPTKHEKRRAVYDALKNILKDINTSGEVENDCVYKLYDLKEESNFLFNDDIPQYIRVWIVNAIMLQRTDKKIKSSKTTQKELEAAQEKNIEALEYFSNQYDEIIKIFRLYLHVDSN